MGKERREQGHLERKKRVVKKRKISLEELKAFVEAHPDAFLREIAAHFDCAVPSVWAALKQIHVTLKKTTSFKEQDPEKVTEFLDILNNLKIYQSYILTKRESTATSIVLMHRLLEWRKSMKRLADGVLSGLRLLQDK